MDLGSCQGMLNVFDDTVVDEKGEEAHNAIVLEAVLTLKPDKCKVAYGETKMLIKTFGTHQTQHEVMCSLGLEDLCSEFIPHFLKVRISLKTKKVAISAGDQINNKLFFK